MEKKIQEHFHLAHDPLDLGTNVVNASLSFAHMMGCNPLITVGVDLAYSGGASYGPGLKKPAARVEPLHTKSAMEEVIVRPDIEGKPVATLWKWVNESMWYTEFQRKHPEATLINATEGGIGFVGIPHLKLADVAAIYLNESWDLSGKVHAALQQACVPTCIPTCIPTQVDRATLRTHMEAYLASLKNIERALAKIEPPPGYGVCEEVEALASTFQEELAWGGLLVEFDQFYRNFVALQGELDPQSPHRVLELLKGHVAYLKAVAQFNVNTLEAVLAAEQPEESVGARNRGEGSNLPSPQLNPQLSPLKRAAVGNSNFYDAEGALLASTTYKAGLKEGAAQYWYNKGGLSANLHFSHGRFEGTQEYFYPNGVVKSTIPYAAGLLDGEVQLFWPNGQKKRSAHFKNHKREGGDYIWSKEGILLFEAHYVDDRPQKVARSWSPTGVLLLEITYNDAGEVQETRAWDLSGEPIKEEKDYFSHVVHHTGHLTTALEEVCTQLKGALEAAGKQGIGSAADIEALQEELQRLKELGGELEGLSSEGLHFSEAAFHPQMEKQVKDEVAKMSEHMHTQLQKVGFHLKHMRRKLHPDE